METRQWSEPVIVLNDRLNGRHSPIRVEVFVRSLAPDTARPQQDNLIQRLQNIETKGDIESVDLYVTGGCICESTAAASTDTGQLLLNRFKRFEAWADDLGVELVGFRDRCVDSAMSMTTMTGHQFPRIAVAVFSNGDLDLVTPFVESDTQHTVAELVAVLESHSESVDERGLSA